MVLIHMKGMVEGWGVADIKNVSVGSIFGRLGAHGVVMYNDPIAGVEDGLLRWCGSGIWVMN